MHYIIVLKFGGCGLEGLLMWLTKCGPAFDLPDTICTYLICAVEFSEVEVSVATYIA